MSPEESVARPTTRQSKLFSLYMRDGEDHRAHEERLAHQRFSIEDDLLYSCITYGDGLETKDVDGFTHSKGLGYALLVFFAKQALGLYRLPFCEDRILSDWMSPSSQINERLTRIIQQLTPGRISTICSEVSRLYEHTQRQLSNVGVKSVTITRRVHDVASWQNPERQLYSSLLFTLKRAAELTGRDKVSFEMDTLNSFGDDGGYRHFPVTLRMDVPAEDVFYCSNLVASRKGHQKHSVEEGEWVIINRAPNGIVSIPVTWIEIDERLCKENFLMDQNSAQRFLEKYDPLVFRTCCNQRFDLSSGYCGRSWKPTLRGRLMAAWRGFQIGR
ncbi:MAG TPA: hypothetical protein DDZ40_05865 [Deltaproteobacteria bacterium]|nr:hypothetical protein [Deltaproteobacteria bacterium]